MRWERLKYSDKFWAAILLAPNFIGFLVFILFPMIASFFLSFTEWDLLTDIKWIGFGNYQELASDETFWKVLWNTLYYTLALFPGNYSFPDTCRRPEPTHSWRQDLPRFVFSPCHIL